LSKHTLQNEITGLTGINTLILSDARGKRALTIKATSHTKKININPLPAGTYLLQILKNNQLVEIIKLVKE